MLGIITEGWIDKSGGWGKWRMGFHVMGQYGGRKVEGLFMLYIIVRLGKILNLRSQEVR